MAVRPIEDSLENFIAAGSESLCKHNGFAFAEIGEHDAFADIERSGGGIADQIRRHRNAKQAEREPPISSIVDAPVVAFADAGKELIRIERQAARRVDFINED